MMLRYYFPESNIGASKYNGFMYHDNSCFCRIFEMKNSLKEALIDINEFLAANGYEEANENEFNEEHSYKSEMVSISVHGYQKSFVLMINRDYLANNQNKYLLRNIENSHIGRDCRQFHSPQNISSELSANTSKLVTQILTLNKNSNKVKETFADIFSLTLLLANKLDLDIEEVVLNKIGSMRFGTDYYLKQYNIDETSQSKTSSPKTLKQTEISESTGAKEKKDIKRSIIKLTKDISSNILTDKNIAILKKEITILERDLELQSNTINFCRENTNWIDSPLTITSLYYLNEKYNSDGEIELILEPRGLNLNPDYWELKDIEKLLRRGFNKCIEEEKKDYLDAFKKMIHLQLLQVDMSHLPYLSEVFGDAPNNEDLLEDIYRIVKKGHFSIGETLSCRDKDYDPNYSSDYWHKTEND